MSNTKNMSRIAFLVSSVISLAACDSGEGSIGGGGGTDPVDLIVAQDACNAVDIADAATSHSGTISVVDGTDMSLYQYAVAQQPTNGTVTIDPSTGDYQFTPNSPLLDSRGFKVSFTFDVLEDDEEVDSGTEEFIYGAKRIMPLGDSITYGVTHFSGPTGNQPDIEDAVGYRKTLYDRLIAEGYPVDFVGPESAGGDTGLTDTDHAGFPGFEADQVFNPVNTWFNASTANKTDIIMMHVGTNDLYQQDSTTLAVSEVSALVGNFQTWQTSNDLPLTILAAKIIPPNPSAIQPVTALSLGPIFTAFNAELETTLTASYNNAVNTTFQLHMVDQASALNAATDLTNLTIDTVGLHPTDGGYAKMATTWYNSLISSGELVKCD